MLQLMPGPPGRASVKARPLAAPAPSLVSVTVKPIWSPALTVSASEIFEMPISAQRTSTVGGVRAAAAVEDDGRDVRDVAAGGGRSGADDVDGGALAGGQRGRAEL